MLLFGAECKPPYLLHVHAGMGGLTAQPPATFMPSTTYHDLRMLTACLVSIPICGLPSDPVPHHNLFCKQITLEFGLRLLQLGIHVAAEPFVIL